MNSPYNLSHAERGITPKFSFNKGINIEMSAWRRAKKQARHRENEQKRRAQSMGRLYKQ